MKNIKLLYTVGLAVTLSSSFVSCDSYLDENPDNRAEIDSEEKVTKLLVSAYPVSSYSLINELASDNIDDMGDRYDKYDDRFLRQAYGWTELTESDNEGTENIWNSYYSCISAANHALEAIEEMGGATTQKLREDKAEALLCRAYGHFVLVNEFCLNYNPTTSSTDLGITYMTHAEKTVSPEYKRGTVAEVYENINKDIQEALPLIGDTHLDVPKYHFNTQAAYAFAARFYLFYEKWDKAVEYATKCLGSNPKSMLRDWDNLESYGITDDLTPRTNEYINASSNCNLLLCATYSQLGVVFSNWVYATKYAHNSYISSNETLQANNIWGSYSKMRCLPLVFKGGSMDRVLVAKFPYLKETIDQTSGSYYLRTVCTAFTADCTLLERAEAYTMLGKYAEAAADLTTWMQNWTTSTMTLTPETIVDFYDKMAYSSPFAPTMKKQLNPAFSIADGTQESMLQCVLNFKRLETLHEGYRWFDIKRYGIKIYRRKMNASSEVESVTDSLDVNDKRRAIQLPSVVISAGIEANPR